MSTQDNPPTKKNIDNIFVKYVNCPEYIDTPKKCGSRPIAIEKHKSMTARKEVKQPEVKKKPNRRGKKQKIKKQNSKILRFMV